MGFLKQFLIYGVSGAASRLAALILVPIYTRTLSIETYGLLEVLLAVHTLTVLIAGLQSESAVARDYFEAEKEARVHGLTWGAVLISVSGAGILLVGVALAAALDMLPADILPFLPLIALMILPAQLLGIQLVVLRFSGSPMSFAFISFLDLALSAIFSVILIVGMGMGVAGALLGLLAGKTICVALAWPRTFGRPRELRSTGAFIKPMLAYSLPVLGPVLLNWIQTHGSRILLAVFLSLSDVAVAGIAMKVGALYGLLVYSFRLVWEPYAFKGLAEVENNSDFYNRILHVYALAMFVAGGLVTVASPLLVLVLAPPSYAVAAGMAGLFIMGQFWVGMISILAIGIHGARVTPRLLQVYGAGAVLNVILLAVLSGYIGASAAGFSFLGSSIVSALLAAYYSKKHFGTRFSGRLLGWTGGASAIFATGAYLSSAGVPGFVVPIAPFLFYLVVTASLTVAGAAMIALFGFDRRGRAELRASIRSWKTEGSWQ